MMSSTFTNWIPTCKIPGGCHTWLLYRTFVLTPVCWKHVGRGTSCGPLTAFLFGYRCTVGVLPGPTSVPQSPGWPWGREPTRCRVGLNRVVVWWSCSWSWSKSWETSLENTYTPCRLEALYKLSLVLILSHFVRSIRTICATRTTQDSLNIFWGLWVLFSARHLVEDLTEIFLFVVCSVGILLLYAIQICSTSRRLINYEEYCSAWPLDITVIFVTTCLTSLTVL